MAKAMISGKAKGSGKPRKAPKVAAPKPINGNYMKESDTKLQRKSPMLPMKQKRLSK
jgi:hypothetical protein